MFVFNFKIKAKKTVILAAVLGSLGWYAIRNSRANRDYFGM